jgi:hypothetical protein
VFWVSSSPYSSNVDLDRFSIPTMDMSALTFVQSGSDEPSEVLSTTLTSTYQSPRPLPVIPEEYYDYLPSEHRKMFETIDVERAALSTEVYARPPLLRSKSSPEVSGLLPNRDTLGSSGSDLASLEPPPPAVHSVNFSMHSRTLEPPEK